LSSKSRFRGIGGDNSHPGPAEAIRRIRVLTIGKDPANFVNNPNVKSDDEEGYNILSKHVTDDLEVSHGEHKHGEPDQLDPQPLPQPVLVPETEPEGPEPEPEPTEINQNLCFRNALQHVGGWIAHKIDPEKYGESTDNDTKSWTHHLSRGGLIIPNKELTEMCENLEKEFKMLHGETINLTHDPKGQFLKNVITKYPDYPKKIVEKFNNLRFNAQIRYLNRKKYSAKKANSRRHHKQQGQFLY